MKQITPHLPSHRNISLSLLFVVLFYLVYIVLTGHEALFSALDTLQIIDWVIILSCSLGNYLFRFIRWQYYLGKFNYHVPVFRNFAYYIAGFSLTTTPGKAGETIRSLYLHHHGVKFSTSLAAFFTERFLDVIVIACLSLLALLHFIEYQSVIITSIAILLILVIMFAYGNTHHIIERLLPLIKIKLLNQLLKYLSFFLSHTKQLFAFRSLSLALILGTIAWLLQGLAFIYLLQHFGIEINLWVALGLYAASLLAGAISFIPGGVGTTEAAMAFLLIAFGTDKQTALIIPIITRIASLWFAVSLGAFSTLLLGLSGIKINHHQPDTKAQDTRHSE